MTRITTERSCWKPTLDFMRSSSREQGWNIFNYGTNDGYDFYLSMGPLSNAKKRYFNDTNFYWDDQVQHPNYDEFWKMRDISAHMKRSEEHTSELQSHSFISYAVF